jgi:ornithine cyclodeaminase/alanine dehydrogenase-like protein (mu-crystallin family)
VFYGAGRQIRDHATLLLNEYHRSIQHVAILNRSAKAGSELIAHLNAITCHSNTGRGSGSDSSNASAADAVAACQTQTQTHITNVKFELFTREDESEWETNWESATRAADIICMATPSTSPVLKEEWVQPGQHFILVGSYRGDMAEVPTAVIRRASKVVVDSCR